MLKNGNNKKYIILIILVVVGILVVVTTIAVKENRKSRIFNKTFSSGGIPCRAEHKTFIKILSKATI